MAVDMYSEKGEICGNGDEKFNGAWCTLPSERLKTQESIQLIMFVEFVVNGPEHAFQNTTK